MPLDFTFLADRPEFVPEVARWWFNTWPRPGARLDEMIDRLASNLHRDVIPIQLIALENDHPVGSAVLKHHELHEVYPELKNWLGSVFVVEQARCKGVASALCARAIDRALDLRLPSLHLQTERLDGGLYARLGWEPLHRTCHEGLDRLVMRKQLSHGTGASSALTSLNGLAIMEPGSPRATGPPGHKTNDSGESQSLWKSFE